MPILNQNLHRKILIICLFVAVFVPLIKPLPAQAQGLNVPIGTDFNFHNIMGNAKDFILDRAATAIAKQLLHQLTTSVINWINTGFEGSPSFITNPNGFFLDAADQVTGEFLEGGGGGPLSNLCSPFSFDIRLTLALQMSARNSQRYTCTLGKIIQNTKDAAARGITINGFNAGDFSQGGWASFVALSTEPQNSYSGAYLYAHSDLLSRISKKHSEVNMDLNRGRGFLSFNRCKDVTENVTSGDMALSESQGEQFKQFGNQTAQTGQAEDGESTSLKKKVDKKTGGVTYQSCKTETPGSVIENSLANQLGSSVRELELADSINAVFDALVSKMVSVALEKGLSTLSDNDSGGKGSYTARILNESRREGEIARKQLEKDIDSGIKVVTTYKANYDQTVTLLTETKSKFDTARTCLVTKSSLPENTAMAPYFQSQISMLDSFLTTDFTPLFTEMVAKQLNAEIQMQQLNSAKTSGLATTTEANPDQQLQNYLGISELVATIKSRMNVTMAADDVKKVKEENKDLTAKASTFQNACNKPPTNP